MEGGISRPRGLQCRTLSREGSPSPSITGWVRPAVNPQEGHLSSASSRPMKAGSQLHESTASRGGELEMGLRDLVLRYCVSIVLRQERTFQFTLLG